MMSHTDAKKQNKTKQKKEAASSTSRAAGSNKGKFKKKLCLY